MCTATILLPMVYQPLESGKRIVDCFAHSALQGEGYNFARGRNYSSPCRYNYIKNSLRIYSCNGQGLVSLTFYVTKSKVVLTEFSMYLQTPCLHNENGFPSCNFLTRNGLHTLYVMNRKLLPPEYLLCTVCTEMITFEIPDRLKNVIVSAISKKLIPRRIPRCNCNQTVFPRKCYISRESIRLGIEKCKCNWNHQKINSRKQNSCM